MRAITIALLALTTASTPARAQSPSPYSLPTDPVLSRLISESLSALPELRSTQALVRAQAARVPQAGALPDPMIQVGIQNDGFTSWEVGEMENSYYSIMASQAFPWPGKRGLRSEIAELGVGQSKRAVERLRLSTEADVRRLYIALILVRDRLAVQGRLVVLWEKSAEVARAVYEAGGGSQADLLRSQLELGRLKQRRVALQAEERTLVQGLNRLRGHALDEAIVTPVHLAELGTPALIDEKAAVEHALASSPELAAARISVNEAGRRITLAKKSYYPDLTVSAGIMPRGVDLPPMWLLTVGGAIPMWAGRKQDRAVEESEALAAASRSTALGFEQVLRLRVGERLTALSALMETIRIYREGLLVQSEATAESTLAQFRVGKVGFTAVLDANAGLLADEDAFLQAIAEAQRLAIAAYEISLEPVPLSAGGAMSRAGMPGLGAMGAASAASTTTSDASASEGASAGTDRSMSGM
ncbi:MAG: TolC family protein [Deltaproteobacteria bacterium]|nr:TolC family protein [Deltaproteobacteria bacterium]